ncbi:PREDICTED: LOW QUALITY PROTEIN: p53 and DNA damage-regulated protein 1-like [Brassica oleracea var. oleracea]|uniref:LOW QUALITY PROTEIN: p53 and DNA damage-regulated protein 1-like n=1 Tax=Brassica oleracea var. oleracea TaxID=109376 RepID=UPI0006A6B5EF|nr:PREDICTED: LOW QUALITY PROTEIN: p53 and DNA damage-regulated protein 1-like [Brassica oleracea var. oleracea]
MELDPKKIIEVLEKYEAEADQIFLIRSQMVESDRERNANREALTALRNKARTTKTEPTWMMLPGADLFVAVPFHAVHTMLEKDEEKMGFESKKLQSLVKEKTFFLSELGPLADCIPPGVIRSLVALKDKP